MRADQVLVFHIALTNNNAFTLFVGDRSTLAQPSASTNAQRPPRRGATSRYQMLQNVRHDLHTRRLSAALCSRIMCESEMIGTTTEPRKSAVAIGMQAKAATTAIDIEGCYDSFNPGAYFNIHCPYEFDTTVCITGFGTDDSPLTQTSRSKRPRRASKSGSKRKRTAKSNEVEVEETQPCGQARGSRNGAFIRRADFARVDEWSALTIADSSGA